jgi:hypothetical protein
VAREKGSVSLEKSNKQVWLVWGQMVFVASITFFVSLLLRKKRKYEFDRTVLIVPFPISKNVYERIMGTERNETKQTNKKELFKYTNEVEIYKLTEFDKLFSIFFFFFTCDTFKTKKNQPVLRPETFKRKIFIKRRNHCSFYKRHAQK